MWSTCLALLSAPALAHHSYVMFDMGRMRTVSGVVAQIEWSNPHVRIWVYVPKSAPSTGYDLYAFQTGGTNVMTRHGWTSGTFAPGEKAVVEYYPLKDGRDGGDFIRATHSDGKVTEGDPAAPQAQGHNEP